MRNLKILGMALSAVLAMSVFAAAAQADVFHTSTTGATSKTTLSAVQVTKHVFKTTGGSISCKTASFGGVQEGQTSTTATLHPVYNECTAFGRAATVDVGSSCNYVFHLTGTSTEPTTDLTCAGTEDITVTVPSLPCNVTIKPQTGLTKSTLTNGMSGGKKDMTDTIAITNISYEEQTGCLGTELNKLHTGGTYEGSATVTGKEATGAGAAVDIWVE
jgi:hypothetical protein